MFLISLFLCSLIIESLTRLILHLIMNTIGKNCVYNSQYGSGNCEILVLHSPKSSE